MKYFFSKGKFSSQLFYKNLDHTTIEVYSDFFHIIILPYISLSGYYYKESVVFQNNEKTIYRTLFSHVLNKNINMENIFGHNEYFIEILKNGTKAKIYQSTKEQFILKN